MAEDTTDQPDVRREVQRRNSNDNVVFIGGKPFISWPAFAPISFELTVLFAAHITVLAFLVYNRLFPGKQPMILHEEQTCNKFVIAMERDKVNIDDATNLLKEHGAIEVNIKNVDTGSCC